MSEKITVDAALGGPWEILGGLIKKHNQEDCSGLRRLLAKCLHNNDFQTFQRMLPINEDEFDKLAMALQIPK